MRTDSILLNLYRSFIFAAKYKNLTIAAEKMNCDPTSISKNLKQLETEFGKKLYLKKNRGIELTEVGQMLYEDLNKGYNMFLLAEKRFNELDGIENGKLSIGIKLDIRKYYLSEILEVFKNKYPNLTIKLLDLESDELYKRLENCNIDIMIDYFNDTTPFNSMTIYEDELCYAYKEDINLEQKIGLILPVKENKIRLVINHYLSKNNVDYKLKYEFSTFSDIAEYINKGYGVSIIPKKIAISNGLKTLPLNEIIKYNIKILFDNEILSGSAQEFLNIIKNR